MIWCAAVVLLALTPAQTAAAPQQVSTQSQQEVDGTRTLINEVTIDAPSGEVWAAVSTPDGWRTWAAPVAWWLDGEPNTMETSYDALARPGDDSTIRQVFVARIPDRLLAFRTTKAPDGFPDFDTYRAVTNVLELEPLGSTRTRVRLTAVGYADTEAGRQLLGFFRNGNRRTLEQLQSRFTEGPIDWGNRQGRSR